MIYIEAPEKHFFKSETEYPSVFLAGGITNCPDWQAEVCKGLVDTDVIVYNPRRADFPIDDPEAAQEQITWEYEALRQVDFIVFWFSVGSLNPIVLFEYGAALEHTHPKNLIVGCHPEYKRLADVQIQTKLRTKGVAICDNLNAISESTKLAVYEVEQSK